jgi:hypothetical protein
MKILSLFKKTPERSTKRIYQIGFNRSGTSSLTEFFKKNGFASIHFNKGDLARDIIKNHEKGLPLFKGYENYQVFTDMEGVLERDSGRYDEQVFQELSKKGVHPKMRRVSEELFREIYQEDPDGVFILNIRPVEDWISSRLNHAGYWRWYRIDENTTQEEVVNYWKKEYRDHINNVKDFFKDKGNLIVFDISKHDGKYLCDSLKKFDINCKPEYWKNYKKKLIFRIKKLGFLLTLHKLN